MTGKYANPVFFMILAIGAIAAGGGISYWQYSNVESLSTQADKLRKDLGSKNELQGRLEQSKQEWDQASLELTHLESTVSTVEYVPTLLQDLQKTGESCHLIIEGVRPVPKVDNKKKPTDHTDNPTDNPVRKVYEELDVEVKCKGSFRNTMDFVKKLENFPKIVAVRQMNINPKIGLDGKTIDSLETTVRIRVFVFPTAPGAAVHAPTTGFNWSSPTTPVAPAANSSSTPSTTTNPMMGRHNPSVPLAAPQQGGRN